MVWSYTVWYGKYMVLYEWPKSSHHIPLRRYCPHNHRLRYISNWQGDISWLNDSWTCSYRDTVASEQLRFLIEREWIGLFVVITKVFLVAVVLIYYAVCRVVLRCVALCCVNYVVLAQWLIDMFSTSVTGLTSCNMHLPDYNFSFTPKSNIRHVPLFWFKCNPRSNYILRRNASTLKVFCLLYQRWSEHGSLGRMTSSAEKVMTSSRW
jgi:hypothetical protein